MVSHTSFEIQCQTYAPQQGALMEAAEALWDEVRWAYLSSRKFAQVSIMWSAKRSEFRI